MQKVVIIGAGPAGLTAAYQLLKVSKKYQVIIIEEDSSIGGISKTINYKGNRIDIGGHRFFTKSEEVKKIWFDILKLESNKQDSKKTNNVMLIRNRLSKIFYKNKLFDYPVTINFRTIRNLGIINTILCGFSYFKSAVFKRKENNLEDFYINRFGKRLYSIFFKDYTKKVWGRKPSNISKEWGEQRVKGLSIKEVIKNYYCKIFRIKQKNKQISLIDKFYYPKFGPGQLYEEMAKKIEKLGGRIITKSKVIEIKKNKNTINSITYVKNGKKIEEKLDILISSMPIKDLIFSMNITENNIVSIANNLPYRDFITVGVLLNKLALKNKSNDIKDCWLYIQDENVKLSRIQIFNNWSPYMVKNKNNIWLGLEYCCNENDSFWKMNDDELKKNAIDDLKKINIIDDDCKVLDSYCHKIKKAYPAYFDSYDRIDEVKEYLNRINNLYCIGRNGQHRYNNMDHSMLTAIKTVEYIVYKNGNKKDIWNVNTENVYHEVSDK